jgi:hypothetical protein
MVVQEAKGVTAGQAAWVRQGEHPRLNMALAVPAVTVVMPAREAAVAAAPVAFRLVY